MTPASLPPIPFIEDEFDNFAITEPADIATVTPKTKFYVRSTTKFSLLLLIKIAWTLNLFYI